MPEQAATQGVAVCEFAGAPKTRQVFLLDLAHVHLWTGSALFLTQM